MPSTASIHLLEQGRLDGLILLKPFPDDEENKIIVNENKPRSIHKNLLLFL
jgi:hypothetical protein